MGWPRLDGIARTNAILAQVRTDHIPLKLAKLPSECDSAIATSSLSPGCHAQRALSQPLHNQAHTFGSVPRECPFASWFQTDDLTLNSFPLAPRQVKLEENHDATPGTVWISWQSQNMFSSCAICRVVSYSWSSATTNLSARRTLSTRSSLPCFRDRRARTNLSRLDSDTPLRATYT
jgi:hypothetical protein